MKRTEFFTGIGHSWNQGRDVPKHIRLAEVPLERVVSEYICRMPFLWVAIDDIPSAQSNRSYVEKHSIGFLSNFAKPKLDPPSRNWLGNSSPELTIRKSGLWNTD